MPYANTASTAKPLLRALRGETLARPPFWLMRQAGRYLPEYQAIRAEAKDFLALCYTPSLAAEITLQPVRRFHMDAAILFADILLVPDALGQHVAFIEGEGPVLEPINSEAAVARLDAERLEEHLAPVLETVRRLRTQLDDTTTLIGFAGAPWTVATYMVDGRGGTGAAAARRWACAAPESFATLIDLLIASTARYLSAQVAAGAEAVQIFDTWAGLLPEQEFARWCTDATARIVRRLRVDHPDVPVISYLRGVSAGLPTFAAETGVDAISIDSSVPLAWAAESLQPKVTVQGNLDPVAVVVGGEAMRRQAARILDMLGRGPFVFNLGHGVLPETPPDHVGELAELVRSWRA